MRQWGIESLQWVKREARSLSAEIDRHVDALVIAPNQQREVLGPRNQRAAQPLRAFLVSGIHAAQYLPASLRRR